MLFGYLYVNMLEYVHCVCTGTHRSGEGIGSLGTGVTGVCEPPYGCYKLNSDRLQEQKELL